MIAAIAGILFGYDTGVMSGAILFIKDEFHLTPGLNGLLMGSVLIGALIGALFSGRIADYFGRKRLLIMVAVIFVLGSVETALATNFQLLFWGRIVIGVAIGIASYTAPLYISEIAPAKHRGALVSLNQLAVAIGILISYIVDYFCSIAGTWRWMLGLGVIPALCLLFGMIFLPHSPRWMISKGFEKKARSILRKIRGHEAEIDAELEEIRMTTKEHKLHWRLLFSKLVRPVVCIGCALAFIQQVTGINTILYYAPTILKMSGFESNTSSILATMGVGVVFVVFTIVALPLIDRWGRRPLLMLGLAGMTIGLAFLSFIFDNKATHGIRDELAIISMMIYIASFAFSLGPIMWLMIAEIYPLKIRGVGASFATFINWASNFLVTATFLQLVGLFGQRGTFLIYMIMCIFSMIFIYFLVPETKGVSLERIEENLFSGKPWRHLGRK
ncbi:MAG: Arabinose-proton symporter [Chlamydiia bacterium]|nr:Arabinose-proton symporter [Chlamydiia bacterium]MCH9616032.1 Arabinose-proton symporter [Chlamydiia bacterium]MCH9629055.1 Arabinose-proton symporter [Chlamydiia bacterium]